jgi:hypothetical protein
MIMNNKAAIEMNPISPIEKGLSWLFGTLFLAIGIVNTFWGNDTGFGLFIILLSFAYFLPVAAIIKGVTGITIPRMGLIKILLGLFILWASLGVGELFDKIALMRMDL